MAVTMEEFIKAWEKAESAQAVADKLGIGKATAQQRATNYRRKGIPLKKFERPKMASLDVDAGQKLLAKIRGTTVAKIRQEGETAQKKKRKKKKKVRAAKAKRARIKESRRESRE